MSGENTGTIGKAIRGGKITKKSFSLTSSDWHGSITCLDVLYRYKDKVPGPGSYFQDKSNIMSPSNSLSQDRKFEESNEHNKSTSLKRN